MSNLFFYQKESNNTLGFAIDLTNLVYVRYEGYSLGLFYKNKAGYQIDCNCMNINDILNKLHATWSSYLGYDIFYHQTDAKHAFIIDTSDLKIFQVHTSSHNFHSLTLYFNNVNSISIQVDKNESILEKLHGVWYKYLAEKEAHEQYKPDGVGYMEAKTEFETLKNT